MAHSVLLSSAVTGVASSRPRSLHLSPRALRLAGTSLPSRPQATSASMRRSCAVRASGEPLFQEVKERPQADSNNHYPEHLTVGDFMSTRLVTVKPDTGILEALEMLVEFRITGLPVVDDSGALVGVVSDYDLLAIDALLGNPDPAPASGSLFPKADSSWKAFKEIQNLLAKTKGKVVGDVMTPHPMTVRSSTNLDEAARLLLGSKYRRLPVLDAEGKLVGLLTRGNVVKAALEIKQRGE